jgi:ATP-dependent exoDNAse (exonuclease V) alpha subunit
MQLTTDQERAYRAILDFLHQQDSQIFVLTGYAGTGKTTLIRRVLEDMETQERPCRLLATTGRAAKVLSEKTGQAATTLHGCLYRFDELTSGTDTDALQMHFDLKSTDDLASDLVFIIDEASMLSHEDARYGAGITFGSGNVLRDLFDFAQERQIIFVGDPCQLPPVADSARSAALDMAFLRKQGFRVSGKNLSRIVRQKADSEILLAAGDFRRALQTNRLQKYPKVRFAATDSLNIVKDHHALLEAYLKTVRQSGFQEAIMLGYANWQIAMLNRNIRQALYPSADLQPEELLMVVQNNYPAGLANGDQIILRSVQFHARRAGFTFLKVKVQALYQEDEKELLLIRELLYNDQAGLGRKDTQRLLIDFDQRQRKKGVKRKSEAYRTAMEKDPYLNALRAKFGYAITCHKAQGGEWPRVFLNIHRSLYGLPGPQLYRWYYTALTRAQDQLWLNDGWWVANFNQRRPHAAAAMQRAAQRRKANGSR